MTWVNKVCPTCGERDLDVTKTNITLYFCYEDCKADGMSIDYDINRDSHEYLDSKDTTTIIECSQCRHKYTNTSATDVIIQEMITEEEFKNKQAKAKFEQCENCIHWTTTNMGVILTKSCHNPENLPTKNSIILTHPDEWCENWEKDHES